MGKNSGKETFSNDILFFGLFSKALLFSTYFSTDFEVHRNWLAITHNLPISKWYYEETSEWTLDYPPFFAWFEWSMSWFASFFDPELLKIENLNYASPNTIIFQRLTVLTSELLLFLAVCRFLSTFGYTYRNKVIATLIYLSPGFYFIDHIHFQYNGFLFGILVLSLTEMMKGNVLLSGALFSVLLNFKHIYLYLAPAYFAYILKTYCFTTGSKNKSPSFSFYNLVKMGLVVVSIFIISLGPFAYLGQLGQLATRLFPFKRGLCHAYWAPNFWALYSFLDRVLIQWYKYLGIGLKSEALQSATRGIVGDISYGVLPTPTAAHTFQLTFLTQLPFMISLFRNPNPSRFIGAVVLCGFSSFLFGWHVHEKAILLIIIPYNLLFGKSEVNDHFLMILSITGYFSLFPLLIEVPETPIKLILFTLWSSIILGLAWRRRTNKSFQWIEWSYLLGSFGIQLYTSVLHSILFDSLKYQFFPLMLISVYSAIGVLYSWLGFSWVFLTNNLK
ncbi:glycosyl transferase [Basidiobolus ranarum]|uniref:Alpha-1,3-glucosyltransferase n=1 Tax=Basidiobolus ranarum TaxID=34480 RepID=A0ABR2WAU2_9FUNG